MYEDLRTPEYKAEMDKRLAADERKRKKAKDTIAKVRGEATGWQPIETCPFAAYARYYGDDRTVLISDGEKVVIATIQERFGRPIKVVEEPTMAFTDHGMSYVGGKYEEYDRPKWWFDFEFKDELEYENERYGKPEIEFVPTHWMPLPAPPAQGIETAEPLRRETGSARKGESPVTK